MAGAVSLLATLVTFAFAAVVVRQYVRRPRLFRLVWALALVFYGIATAVQFQAELGGWTVLGFRLWYLSGGLLTAAYLGQGTACLLLSRRSAGVLLAALAAASAWAAARTFAVPLTFLAIAPQAGKLTPNLNNLPDDMRWLAALLNIYGTLLLIGGAAWSAVVWWDRSLDRRRSAGHRVLSTVLIAAGSFVVAAAGSFQTFGHGEYLYAAEIVGISIIFLGFLRSQDGFPLQLPRHQHVDQQAEPGAPAPASPSAPVRSLRRISDRRTPTRR